METLKTISKSASMNEKYSETGDGKSVGYKWNEKRR